MADLRYIFKVLVGCYSLLTELRVIFSEIIIESRIVNGLNATFEDVPFLVQIVKDGGIGCAGTRASPRHIITAAHCVNHVDPDRLFVVGNVSSLNDYGIRADVLKVLVHPYFNPSSYDMDISVLILKSDLIGPFFKLPSRCVTPIKAGDEVKLFGWGIIGENSNIVPDQLQTVTVEVVDFLECQLMYRNTVLTENMFCAALPGKDSCKGDSGGPALVNGQFCGIISWGFGCARPDFPGVYTKINNALRFLFDAFSLKNLQ